MKRANSGINCCDMISALPDLILSLILSLMPTVNAVATYVLSKRWKSLWKSVHNLDFNLDSCRCGSNRQCYDDCRGSVNEVVQFGEFVNNVLLLHDGGFVNKFSLVLQPICFPFQVISWTTFAILSNVQELCLCINKFNEPFEIPSNVFGCQTLKSLELNGNMFVSDSIAVCLPRLEKLKLVSFYFQSDVAFNNVISGCPVLDYLFVLMDMEIMTEYFEAYQDNRLNLFTFRISSSSLRSFSLYVEFEGELFEATPYCGLELEAPSLVYLHLEGFVPRISMRNSLSSLIEAEIDLKISELFDANINDQLVEAIGSLNCARSLRLSESVIASLSLTTVDMTTKFKRLTDLWIQANCCYCSAIQDFIESSENLQVLRVEKMVDCLDSNQYHTFSNWTTPEEVPRCLSKSLNTVHFDGFGGFVYEYSMTRYMLEHGSALEVIVIRSGLVNDDRLKLVEEICSFPRKSSCIIKFPSCWP